MYTRAPTSPPVTRNQKDPPTLAAKCPPKTSSNKGKKVNSFFLLDSLGEDDLDEGNLELSLSRASECSRQPAY
ncbi:hypothetical protein GOP47_0030812 [Adiantum capillus-veneris]|nr:hypothetical protein GOP47_0030812 [Adiantum capillus-veneris]